MIKVRTIAVAAALAALVFFATVGFMSVFFAKSTDTFVPKSSADVAGWVQAIGSIVAILASYHLGARQAEESKRQEAEKLAKQNAKQASIGTLVQTATDRALREVMRMLKGQGDVSIAHVIPSARKVLDETLTTLQAVPMVEVDPPGNMQHITGIISGLNHVKEAMQQLQVALNPPRGTKIYDPAILRAEMENARMLFHHSVMYRAVSVFDHLTSLGFPSQQPNPIHGYMEPPST